MRPSSLTARLSACLGPLRWAGGLVLWLAACAGLPAQAAQGVALLLSEPAGIYLEAAQALQQELARGGGPQGVRFLHVEDRPALAGGTDELIVALGVRALRYALDAPGATPLLALLVPSMTFEKLTADLPQASRRRAVSALFLDQPFARQLQLIRLALPQARRVGVLLGPATAGQADALKAAGLGGGLEIRIQPVDGRERLFAGLNELARDADVLLLLPDPNVVSGDTLRALFLQSYQLRLPIVAYAAGLVQAGAILGLYATPAQLGGEAGRWIRETQGERSATRFPRGYTVEVNRNVARTLELSLPSVESLGARLDPERGR